MSYSSKQFASVAVIVSTIVSGTALAQQVPNAGDALRQAQPAPPPTTTQKVLPPIGGAQVIEPPLSTLPNGPKVAVSAVQVIGNRVVATPTLQVLVAGASGRELSLSDLEEFAQRITKYYRQHGYFVARAYVPAQEIIGGVVKIRVVEGAYGKFHLRNGSLVRDRVVQGMLDDVKNADVVSVDTLERAMLIINDTPGVKVTRADVLPGQAVGTSDFAIETVATAPYDGYLMFDNFGSVYTGRDRFSFGVDANSPTGSGDKLSLSGLTTEHGDLLNGRVAYSAPLAANGLRGEIAASQTGYRLADAYTPLDATGHATAVDADLSYPIRRTEAQTLAITGDLGYKNLIDDLEAADTHNPRTELSATVALSLKDQRLLLGIDGLTQANLGLTIGHLSFNDDASEAIDAAGADTQGSYSKLVASLNRVSYLTNRLSLDTAVSGQYAINGKSLDGTERMSVSGSGAVVAYPPDELIGDSAVLGHLDLDGLLVRANPADLHALVFTDLGEAWDNYEAAGIAGHRHIADTGVGLNASGHGLFLHASLAHRLSSAAPLSEPYPRNKLLVQVGWVY